jgi:hypothetical protein
VAACKHRASASIRKPTPAGLVAIIAAWRTMALATTQTAIATFLRSSASVSSSSSSRSVLAWTTLFTVVSGGAGQQRHRVVKRPVRLGFLTEKAKRGRYKLNVYHPAFSNLDE